MGWGFDIFQKFAVKFPAHGQIIPVKYNQISPPRAAHCTVKYPKAGPKKSTIKISLRRIQKPLGESPDFVSLNIKGTEKVIFISLQ